jgi:hypothetical protein
VWLDECVDEMCGWTAGMAGRQGWLDDRNGWTSGVAGRREWLDDGCGSD